MQFISAVQGKLSSKIRVPDVDFAALATQVDDFCSTHINNVVGFLDKHPGISMALSPTTVLRRCAQKHADKQMG